MTSLAATTGGGGPRRPSPAPLTLELPQAKYLLLGSWVLILQGALIALFLRHPRVLHAGEHPACAHRIVRSHGRPLRRRRRLDLRRTPLDLVDRDRRDVDLERLPPGRRGAHGRTRGLRLGRARRFDGDPPRSGKGGRRQDGGPRAREREDPIPAEGDGYLGGHLLHPRHLPGALIPRHDVHPRELLVHRERAGVHDAAGRLRASSSRAVLALLGALARLSTQPGRVRRLGLLHLVLPRHAADRPAVPDLPGAAADRLQPSARPRAQSTS